MEQDDDLQKKMKEALEIEASALHEKDMVTFAPTGCCILLIGDASARQSGHTEESCQRAAQRVGASVQFREGENC